jgi:hypothetical protein
MSPRRPDAAPAVKPIEVSSGLKSLMRRLKLGQLLDTLPERLALARSNPVAAPSPTPTTSSSWAPSESGKRSWPTH